MFIRNNICTKQKTKNKNTTVLNTVEIEDFGIPKLAIWYHTVSGKLHFIHVIDFDLLSGYSFFLTLIYNFLFTLYL